MTFVFIFAFLNCEPILTEYLMGKKKKSTKRPKKQLFNAVGDGRLRKIMGILCLFGAVYLLIAIISYLYTWKADQDKVLKFSWNLIFEGDQVVDNWLGRLGAYVSNLFMYWGFGISSMLAVPLMIKLGIDLIKKNSFNTFFNWFRTSLVIAAFSAILLEFIFRSSDFAWGGTFGSVTTYWLSNFIGQLGLAILLIFLIAGFIIWHFNPRIENITLNAPNVGNINIPMISLFQADKTVEVPKFFKQHREKDATGETTTDDNSEDLKGYVPLKPNVNVERPSSNDKVAIPKTTTAGGNSQEDLNDSIDLNLPEPVVKRKPKTKENLLNAELEINQKTESSDTDNQVDPALFPILEDNRKHSEPYDPKLDLAKYQPPSVDLLESYDDQKFEIDRSELEANKNQIIETLLNYKIEIIKIRATIGPTVTLYEIVPAPGVKISKIKNLENDIALSLAALGIRIIAPIPGKGTIGIEVPNKKKQIVSLKEVLKSDKFKNAKMDLPIALGKTISNEVFVADLTKMPHLLIAGATGQGKSVGINTILMSILYKKHPSQVKLVLVDPKKVELFPYSQIDKHFLAFMPDEEESILTDTSKVIYTLNSLCVEMDSRYDLLKKARARNIKEYNEKFVARKLNPNNGHKFMPFIVLVIDEFADLIMTAGKEVELPIARLAQLSRAVGIHLIIATQRPSVNIITGMIKANFPARIAFKVTSKIDSRTILDNGGADQLIGRGDMLLSVGGNIVRLQCAFVDTPEVEEVIEHIASQKGYPEPFYLPEYKTDDDISLGNTNMTLSDLDDCFEDAARLVVANQTGSTSMIQRKMQLGYNRAGRIMDQMEALGIVGPAKGSKPRDVLMHTEMELLNFIEQMKKG